MKMIKNYERFHANDEDSSNDEYYFVTVAKGVAKHFEDISNIFDVVG